MAACNQLRSRSYVGTAGSDVTPDQSSSWNTTGAPGFARAVTAASSAAGSGWNWSTYRPATASNGSPSSSSSIVPTWKAA